MPFAEAPSTTITTDFDVERLIGSCHGIRVECWTAPERGKAVLVVSPTVSGFTVLIEGGADDVPAMVQAGGYVLEALAGVVPLVTGEAFRGSCGIVQAFPSDLRQ